MGKQPEGADMAIKRLTDTQARYDGVEACKVGPGAELGLSLENRVLRRVKQF